MADETQGNLPAKRNLIRPPFWGNMMARAVSDIAEGEVVLRFTNGAERTIKAAQHGAKAVLEIARARSFRRLLLGGEIGLAESYLDGDWSSPDLASVFEFGARNMNRLADTLTGIAPLEWARMVTHKLRGNTKRGARKNIAAHYDLGNAF
jgi:cyclopropane-fatty-acyl-phospholipid synthase